MLDPAKLSSLESQREDNFHTKKVFSKSYETIFNLSHINTVLMNIITEQGNNGKNIFKYQDIKLDYLYQAKASLVKNTKAYVNLILEAINKQFTADLPITIPI